MSPKEEHAMKANDPTATNPVTLMVTAAVLVGIGLWVLAYQSNGGIEASIRGYYTFKTYHNDDATRIQAENGVTAVTGTVAADSNAK